MPIPTSHPKIYQSGRPAYLIAQRIANSQYWQDFQADRNVQEGWRLRQYVWNWVANNTAQNKTDMLAKLDLYLDLKPGGEATGNINNFLENGGLVIGDWVEDIAYAYDWAYAELSATQKAKCEDLMLLLIQIVYNQGDPWVRNIREYDLFNWGNETPHNNYFPAKFKAIVFAYLAMYGAIPTTTNLPLADPTNRFTWYLPMPGGTTTTSLEVFIAHWLGQEAVASLDSYMSGGAWHEGNSGYGGSPFRNYFDMFLALKDCGGPDYAAGKSWYSDRIMHVIHNALPLKTTFERGEPEIGFSGSVRTSVLMAVDALRQFDPTNPALGFGQHWLNSGYSNTRTESKNTWGLGHDFFFWNDTVTALDYTSSTPLAWHSTGAGYFNTRSNFSATADCLQARAFMHIEGHDHHDSLDVQIYRFGHGLGRNIDGFLLCDAKTGGSSNFWQTKHHNSYTLGGGGLPYLGVDPPAMGFQQRLANNTTTSLASILQTSNSTRIAYCQMEANNAYKPIANQGWNNTGENFPSICDICMREVVHIRALGVAVFYDRVRLINQWANQAQPGKTILHLHYPKVEPTDVGGGIRRVTNGENRMFRKFIYPLSGMTTVWEADEIPYWQADALPCFAERVTLPQTYSSGPDRQYSRALIVFEFGDKDVLTAMTTTAAISAVDIEGVTIKHALGWHHVVFSAKQDGTVPTTITYQAEKNANGDRHFICNLTPGQTYVIDEALVSGSIYQYTLGSTGTAVVRANGAGIVEFSRGQLIPSGRGGTKVIPTEP